MLFKEYYKLTCPAYMNPSKGVSCSSLFIVPAWVFLVVLNGIGRLKCTISIRMQYLARRKNVAMTWGFDQFVPWSLQEMPS